MKVQRAYLSALGDTGLAVVRRTWRFVPLVVVLSLAFVFVGQRLAQPSSSLTFGKTAVVSFDQGPGVLLTVRSMTVHIPPKNEPSVRIVTFKVAMKLGDPADSLTSGDALASYCSVIDRSGTVYPSDLARSSSAANTLNFKLQGAVVQEGLVVVLIPARVQPSGVLCQFGFDIDTWRER